MSDIAIRVENLGKQYRLGKRERYSTLRGAVSDALTAPFRFGKSAASESEVETLWALKNVCFEVKHGEVLGVIGRNGAGKSTLLKILSRITDPTEGHAEIHGRVGSLLEVGTGFHPELTGGENILLNGAILGMKKAEILRNFDAIVAFAEVEKFIDTPVKHYSSGMYVRLAFAVAAHLEPEILIVDEVLAVGDAQFQKKCLGKMGEVSQQGRTVLFVSHNMAAVRQLTGSGLLLDCGGVLWRGKTSQAIDRYLELLEGASSDVYELAHSPRRHRDLSFDVKFLRLSLGTRTRGVVDFGQEIHINAQVIGNRDVGDFRFSFTIFQADGTPVGSGFSESRHNIHKGQIQDLQLIIGAHNLVAARYHLGVAVGKGNDRCGHVDFDVVLEVCHFEVLPPPGEEGTLSRWNPGWGAVNFTDVRTFESRSYVESEV